MNISLLKAVCRTSEITRPCSGWSPVAVWPFRICTGVNDTVGGVRFETSASVEDDSGLTLEVCHFA